MSFTAQYHGECYGCGHELKDTECRYRGEDLVHVRCPEDAPDELDRSKVCPDCFTDHRGECL